MRRLGALVLAIAVLAPGAALAWGAAGHRMIGEAAVRALPPELPAFLRGAQSAAAVGELSREPDRMRASGRIHDNDRNPDHFIDLGDDGRVFGGPAIAALPATREDYETALRADGQDSWKAGWLPYAIVDRWEQLAKDFAYWRVLEAAKANPQWRAHRAWFVADQRRREALILADLGELSHFVGDGSQPLHVSVHFNGWGDFPNPQGFTNARLHVHFEGDFVRDNVRPADVAAGMTPFRSCACPVLQRTEAYLADNLRQVVPFYALEKAGGLKPGDARGRAFATARLAVAAGELRDLTVEAWRASLAESVGYGPPVAVRDVLAGKGDPYNSLWGPD